jgi:Tol biopolymer transport system component/tRNA A-37 threonylcarbamoyl transferase component Bud32
MAVSAGSKLGRYEVLSFVGAGGMGEVYRALDTRLRREVAIKVLRSDRHTTESGRRRFIQEARTASALNHPNIATIHDIATVDGTDFIVMEYVTGQPLSALVRSGMSIDAAIRVAIPIADALDRAHSAGIVHRDLKPANVVVAADGTVKVLDFGLAKLVESPDAGREQETATEETLSDLLNRPDTVGGGTPGYMAPEQATGGKVDRRSDIFSFGAMLYEMVTGRRAFKGRSVAETLTKVLCEEPTSPCELTPDMSKELERLILRCLRKEPERRLQDMADVKVELLDLQEDGEAVSPLPAPVRGRRRHWLWLAAGLTIALALTASILIVWRRGDAALPPMRVVPLTASRGIEATPAFSPDGSQLAFAWDGERSPDEGPRNFDIWLKLIGSSEARRLTTDPLDDMGPSWSPDGRYIAFHRGRRGETATIYLMSPLGGAERKLTDLPAAGSNTSWFRGAAVPQLAWSPDGRWLAVARARAPHETAPEAGGIHLIPIDGGEPHPITAPKAPAWDRDPAFSPDGRHLAYASCASGAFAPLGAYAPCDAFVADLDSDFRPTAPPRRLTRHDLVILGLAWTRDGRSLVYGGARYDLSHLWRVDVDGRRPPERIEAARQALSPATVPSQNRLAFALSRADNDIHVFEAGRPQASIVSSSLTDFGPTFSPDGRRIAFESGRSGEVEEIWLANADGSNPVQLTRGPGGWQGSPSWSPDGRRIAFDSRGADGFSDIWTIDVDGGGLRRVTSGALNDVLPTWSVDGRWIYYQKERPDGSDIWRVPETGGAAERVTRNGGFRALEAADGNTLFFVRRDDESPLFRQPVAGGPGRQVVDCVLSRSVAVGPDGIYYVGCPAGVPESPLYRLDVASGVSQRLGIVRTGHGFVPGMAVSPDGKRVLFSVTVDDSSDLLMIENFR